MKVEGQYSRASGLYFRVGVDWWPFTCLCPRLRLIVSGQSSYQIWSIVNSQGSGGATSTGFSGGLSS